METHCPAKAFLFDMDGTLLLSTQTPDESWQHVCSQFAPQLHLSPSILVQALRESYIKHKRDVGNNADKQRKDRLDPFAMQRAMVEQALIAVGMTNTGLAIKMVQEYDALRETHRKLAPYALDTLQVLRTQQKHLGLLTNGNATYQRRKIEQHHLAPFFDTILIEEEFGTPKSDPRIYIAALEQLEATPQATWMVGDDLLFDIATPHRLGITTIWFDSERQGLLPTNTIKPDHVVHALSELLELERTLHYGSSLD
jgi:putative hydrolase of the HAD superfamily